MRERWTRSALLGPVLVASVGLALIVLAFIRRSVQGSPEPVA